MRFPLLLAALILSISGCGGRQLDDSGDGGAGGAGGVPATTYDFCGQLAMSVRACPHQGNPNDCPQLQTCYTNAARPGALVPIEKCVVAASCDASGEIPCLTAAANAYSAEPAYSGYSSACIAKQHSCPGGTDTCDPVNALLSDALLQAMQACFTLGCDQVSDCLDASMKSLGCD